VAWRAPMTDQPPAGTSLSKTDTQTPVEVARKSPQMAKDTGKTARLRNRCGVPRKTNCTGAQSLLGAPVSLLHVCTHWAVSCFAARGCCHWPRGCCAGLDYCLPCRKLGSKG